MRTCTSNPTSLIITYILPDCDKTFPLKAYHTTAPPPRSCKSLARLVFLSANVVRFKEGKESTDRLMNCAKVFGGYTYKFLGENKNKSPPLLPPRPFPWFFVTSSPSRIIAAQSSRACRSRKRSSSGVPARAAAACKVLKITAPWEYAANIEVETKRKDGKRERQLRRGDCGGGGRGGSTQSTSPYAKRRQILPTTAFSRRTAAVASATTQPSLPPRRTGKSPCTEETEALKKNNW